MSCARRDCSLRKFNTEWDDFFLLYVILCLLSPFSACSACCRLFRWWSFHQHAESASPRRETHGLQFFFLLFLFNFFFAFEFSVFNFFSLLFFLFMCIYPPTRCRRCYNADLKHLFCIFVMCAFSRGSSPLFLCVVCYRNGIFFA